MDSKLKELEAEKQRLTETSRNQGHPQPLVHPNMSTVYRRKVERLGDALRYREHGSEAFELLRSLIEEVRLVPADGSLNLELKGDLAGILAISDSTKATCEPAARALQIKMVAGIGFEPMTFRL